MSWNATPTGWWTHTNLEAQENANEIWGVLGGRGWSKQAVCGVLGNFGQESGYNPWKWEGNVILTSTDPLIDTPPSQIPGNNKHGYGLGQFTPAGKYVHSQYSPSYAGYGPNYADITGNPNDGNAQLLFIDEHADYIPTSSYNWSYSEYKHKTSETVDTMVQAWFANYERGIPSQANMPYRISEGTFWFNFLPDVPPTPGPTRRKGMPLWMMTIPYKN